MHAASSSLAQEASNSCMTGDIPWRDGQQAVQSDGRDARWGVNCYLPLVNSSCVATRVTMCDVHVLDGQTLQLRT